MGIFDKNTGKAERESLELAEASRQKTWDYPSFASGIFRGKIDWDIIYPFPAQSEEDRREGDLFLEKLGKFLKENLDPDEVDISREIPRTVIDGLFGMGAFAIKIPKEYGGLGMSQVNYDRAIHLVGSYCGSTAALLSAHQSIGVPQPLMDFGTEEQKKRFLPRFRKGVISAFALTEPGAGSDPRNIKTTAVPSEDGKYFIINGEKLWCTNGNIADILVVMVCTPPKHKNGREIKQITAFIVETNTPGFSVDYRCKFMGLNAIQNGVLKFNNVKVPRENIILGEGQGLKLAFITLNTGRLTLPAAVTGTSKWCLKTARRWAGERRQWGNVIGRHEAVASKLSRMASYVFVMESICHLTSKMVDNKTCDIRLEAAMAKLFCTEESWNIINEAIQIRGGRGYESAPSLLGRGKPTYPLERALRDSRVNTILEGSSEIMRLFIAREALDFHLKRINPLLDPRVSFLKKVKAAADMFSFYMFWYPRLWIPCLRLPGARHLRFMENASKRLARIIFHKMLFYKKNLARRQNFLARVVDIAVDIFAMSSVLSYAKQVKKKEKNAEALAELFAREAEARIRKRFACISHNEDKLSGSIAKEVLSGGYKWLENDII